MNLRVDLILETERRSASVVNAKGLLRIVYIVVPLIILVTIGMVISGMMSLNNELKNRETEKGIAIPKSEAAIKFRAEVSKNRQALEEITGWKTSRMFMAEQLVNLKDIIPAKIQLTSVSISHGFSAENPARDHALYIRGKAFGDGAEAKASVEALADLKKIKSFSELLKDTDVSKAVTRYKQFEQDGVVVEKIYLFNIDVFYLPRNLK